MTIIVRLFCYWQRVVRHDSCFGFQNPQIIGEVSMAEKKSKEPLKVESLRSSSPFEGWRRLFPKEFLREAFCKAQPGWKTGFSK